MLTIAPSPPSRVSFATSQVRGQTPKVAKQDKKKLPKGRAIKRLKVRASPGTPPTRDRQFF